MSTILMTAASSLTLIVVWLSMFLGHEMSAPMWVAAVGATAAQMILPAMLLFVILTGRYLPRLADAYVDEEEPLTATVDLSLVAACVAIAAVIW